VSAGSALISGLMAWSAMVVVMRQFEAYDVG
jgi:hypothetical protein